MNKTISVLVTAVWYLIVGIVCFLGGWLFKAHKMRRVAKASEVRNEEPVKV